MRVAHGRAISSTFLQMTFEGEMQTRFSLPILLAALWAVLAVFNLLSLLIASLISPVYSTEVSACITFSGSRDAVVQYYSEKVGPLVGVTDNCGKTEGLQTLEVVYKSPTRTVEAVLTGADVKSSTMAFTRTINDSAVLLIAFASLLGFVSFPRIVSAIPKLAKHAEWYGLERFRARPVAVAISMGVAVGALLFAVSQHIVDEVVVSSDAVSSLREHWPIVSAILFVLAFPVAEERVFRGVLIKRSAGMQEFILSAALISLVFACLHAVSPVISPIAWSCFFALSVALHFIARLCGHWQYSALAHITYNSVILLSAS